MRTKTRSARPLLGKPATGPVFRDRRVPTRSVACPTCRAQPKAPCATTEGTDMKSTHTDRRRAAIREGL